MFLLNWRMVWWVALCLACQLALSPAGVAADPQKNEILWDSWGVPHVYATSRRAAFYQMGWAQARAHANLIAKIYGQAKGRAAEHWGPQFTQNDVLVQSVEISRRAKAWFSENDKDYQIYIAAFSKGINDYVERHPDALEQENKWVFPIDPVDVMAVVLRSVYLEFSLESWNLGAYLANQKKLEEPESLRGSNAYAISPKRSANGHSMLVINPHMPWNGDLIFFETQVVTNHIDAYGVSLVGMPTLSIAFTPTHGWSHTVNNADIMDIYELTLVDGGYLYDGKVKPFLKKGHQRIRILQDDGSYQAKDVPILESIHGNVIYTNPKTGKALALRFAGIDRVNLVRQYWDMLETSSLEKFEAVVKRQQLPYFNTIYADRNGDIFYLYNSVVPTRKLGDYSFWRQIVPGHRSDLLWKAAEKKNYDLLPKLKNPSSGFIQNSNDSPFFVTYPPEPLQSDYQRQFPHPFEYFRSQRALKMMVGDRHISFPELVNYKQSSRMEMADRVLDDLMAIARLEHDPLLDKAVNVLNKWDRAGNADSRGAVLFIKWVECMEGVTGQGQLSLHPDWFAIPWEKQHPLTTPRGIKNPGKAVKMLKIAARSLLDTYGALDIPYGAVYRLRRGRVDFPAGVAHQSLGSFSAGLFHKEDDKTYSMVGGETFMAVVEFSDPIRAVGLLTYGNSSQPGSPHMSDQLEYFSKRKLRNLWLDRKTVEKHTELKEAVFIK